MPTRRIDSLIDGNDAGCGAWRGWRLTRSMVLQSSRASCCPSLSTTWCSSTSSVDPSLERMQSWYAPPVLIASLPKSW